MPLYDYRCSSCGDFREIRPMKESGEPLACPSCGAMSERVMTTPFVAGQEAGGSVSRVRRYGQSGIKHVCGHNCTHSH